MKHYQLLAGAIMASAVPTPWAAASAQDVSASGSEAVSPDSTAAAQDGNQGGELEEILVTARRVSENLQDVPIAITVATAETLRKNDIRRFEDLSVSVPGLNIANSGSAGRGGPFLNSTNIRGVVGVIGYFADVPSSLQGNALVFDLANIQVLKGPQGTLFGTSTNGGAILSVPRRPDGTLGGYGDVVVGSYGRLGVEAALNIPLVGDALTSRVSFISSKRDGIGERVDTGEELGNENYWAIRASLIARPFDALENYTIVNYYRAKNTSLSPWLSAADPTMGQASRVFGAARVAEALAIAKAFGPYKKPYINGPSDSESAKQLNVVNTTTLELSESVSVKNIFGYERLFYQGYQDQDGSILPINERDPRTQKPEPTRTYSNETQIVGDDLLGFIDLQTGIFFSSLKSDTNAVFVNSFGTVGATIVVNENSSKAVYGQANLDLERILPGLRLTAGYRYTWDKLFQSNSRLTVATLAVNRLLERNAEFEAGSYTLGLQYDVSRDVMLFVTNSKGYTAGGISLTAPTQFQVYQPETLNNIELGVKSQFSTGELDARINASVYYGWYKDKQVPQAFLVQLNPAPAPLSLLSTTTNAGSAKPTGFDIDFSAAYARTFELNGGISYNRAVYSKYDTLDANNQPASKAGVPFLRTPAWKYTVQAALYLPIPESMGRLSLSATYNWYGRMVIDSSAIEPDPVDFRGYWPSRQKLNASVEWRDFLGREGLDASLYATNLTKEIGTGGGYAVWSTVGTTSQGVGDPRMYGLRIRLSF